MGTDGRKDDVGKLRTDLLLDGFPRALTSVAQVLDWAVTAKQPPYADGGWQYVTPFQPRYRAAMMRHILNAATAAGNNGRCFSEQVDDETGLPELAHIAACVLMQLEMMLRCKQ